MSGKFVLLGAGFSRAIGHAMPLLSELGEAVLARLGLPADTLMPFHDLEQWLSFLAQGQPWLDDGANLRNQALFRDVARAVATEISAAEATVLASPPPSWLTRLAWDWASDSAHVATFNYDTLLERGTSNAGLVLTWADLYSMSLERRTAPGDNFMFATEAPPGPVFSLYKLHGSTNWSYGGLAAPVSDRVVITHEVRRWPKPETVIALERPARGRHRPLYDDVEPMIVPPTGTKGPYYGNLSLRAQWRRAFAALAAADELLIIGYSFPASDLVTRHLLSTSGFAGKITVVDRSSAAAEAVETLTRWSEFQTYTGDDAIGSYVAETCGNVVGWTGVSRDGRWYPQVSLDDDLVRETDLSASFATYEEALAAALVAAQRRWPTLAHERLGHRKPGESTPIELAYVRQQDS